MHPPSVPSPNRGRTGSRALVPCSRKAPPARWPNHFAYDKEAATTSTAPGRATYPAAARGHAGPRMEPASDAIKQNPGRKLASSPLWIPSRAQLRRNNEPHGWMGLRFQLQPGGPPNDVLLHINLLDPSNLLQQEGHRDSGRQSHLLPRSTNCKPRNHFWKVWHKTSSRSESRSTTWIFRGPAFESWDRRTLLAHLV